MQMPYFQLDLQGWIGPNPHLVGSQNQIFQANTDCMKICEFLNWSWVTGISSFSKKPTTIILKFPSHKKSCAMMKCCADSRCFLEYAASRQRQTGGFRSFLLDPRLKKDLSAQGQH